MNAKEQGTHIIIETSLGNIEIRLFDETPLHRDNFVQLAKAGFYDGTVFHRVIKDFMIQGGEKAFVADPLAGDEPTAEPSIAAEIVYPTYYHKKGALAAARLADAVNPERASSFSQFYIVTGTVLSDSDLSNFEKMRLERLKSSIFEKLKIANNDSIKELYRNGEKEKLATLRNSLIEQTEKAVVERKAEAMFTAEQRKDYTTIGGTPHLDGEYTVFGEVVVGMDVVDLIQNVKTNQQEKPLEEVRMIVRVKNM